jgi:hypothetical protein
MAVRLGALLGAVVIGICIVGIVGLTFAGEWSLDNLIAGIVIMIVGCILIMPIAVITYGLARYLLLRHGYYMFGTINGGAELFDGSEQEKSTS